MNVNIPFFYYQREYKNIRADLQKAAGDVFASGRFILGDHLESFEQQFAQFCGAPFAVGVASGTDALTLALLACRLKPGDEVITVANGAYPTIVGIVRAGLRPVFVDICPETWLMDPKKIAGACSKKTKAIIPVHLFGNVVDMKALSKSAKTKKLIVIEDACQAHGGVFDKRKAGTFGRFGCFSFYPTKNLGAFGDGGAIIMHRQKDYNALRQLRNYGQSDRYNHPVFGLNSRLDELQAAYLSIKLKYLKGWNQWRSHLAHLYREHLKRIDEISMPRINSLSRQAHHLFVIRVKKRNALQAHLAKQGIMTLIHYPIPAHRQKAFLKLGYKAGDLPHTERCCREILSLPMSPFLKPSEVLYICSVIEGYYKKNIRP